MFAIGQYGFPPSLENLLKAIREMKQMGFEYIEAEGIRCNEIAKSSGVEFLIEPRVGHLRYVHVADNDGRDNRHLVPGHGTVDWEEVFRLLKRKSFDGFFSIDLEKLPDLE